MKVSEWNERYLSREQTDDFDPTPTPLLIEAARDLPPGRALDLACGTGRNALWLAEQGWSTVAVDGSAAAIDTLRRQAHLRQLKVDSRVADLARNEFPIFEQHWDLILLSYYLQRALFEPVKRGVAFGGIVIAIAHIIRPGEDPTENRLVPGELETFFRGWVILQRYEGDSRDPVHKRPVAEIVAQRPGN